VGWKLWGGFDAVNLLAVKMFAVLIQYFGWDKLRLQRNLLDIQNKPN
jgi:hypothetical protein